MPSTALLRLEIEAVLARKIPSALTPSPRVLRPVAPTGVAELDLLLQGGLPLGAITEMTGPESSGRTSVALSFVAGLTGAGRVCAWIDAGDALDPESAAAAGIELSRLLWVRCGVTPLLQSPRNAPFSLPEKYLAAPQTKRGLQGGGFGNHPRNEMQGISQAVSNLLKPESALFCAEHASCAPTDREFSESTPPPRPRKGLPTQIHKPWKRMEHALKATDLLLQAGGFSAIVLDMADIAPQHVSRVELSVWFRCRAAAERTQASMLLLTQHACAKSAGELLLRFQPSASRGEQTVFTGMDHSVEVARRRFDSGSNVIPLKKPPSRGAIARWQSICTWAGAR